MTELAIEEKLALVKTRLKSLERNLSEEQLDFILHSIGKPCYLKACPGSGKTEVVGIKAAYEIAEWKQKFSGIAVLSFTKNAAKEIADRVKKFGGTNATQHPHFIGTMDSWLHGFILHPFAHKATGYEGKNSDKSYSVVESSKEMDFLKNTRYHLNYEREIKDEKGHHRTKRVPYYATEFHLTHDGKPVPNTADERLPTGVDTENLIRIKANFNADGFCTYQDAEYISYRTLKNNPKLVETLAKRFPFIIVDECQDLSQCQLRTFHLLIEKGVSIFLIGDVNQSIYEFRRVDVDRITAFIKHYKLEEKLLTRNFRSNQKIVNVSIGLERYNTGNIPNRIEGNEVERTPKSCILWEYKTKDNGNDFSQLPQKFIDYIKLINSSIENPDLKISLSKSAILARAHTTLSDFRSQPTSDLSKIEMFANALNCWANNPRTGKDMQNALQQIGKSISLLAYNGNGNHQHQYCPESYNQMEWRNQLSDLIIEVTNSSIGLYPFTGMIWSQWALKLKVFLENYWSNFRSPTNDWDSVKSKIKSPQRSAQKLVNDTFNAGLNIDFEGIRMTTFHDVKGETLDAVLVVSAKDKRSKGGHFEHWLSDEANKREFVRFAYVASSRPKHLLIWAIPKNGNNQFINRINDLGFEKE